jgi:RHS repeat-associated protein
MDLGQGAALLVVLHGLGGAAEEGGEVLLPEAALRSRLTRAQVETNAIDNFNPAFTSQVATYDAFGNITGLSAGPRTLQTPVNASTNQLTGGVYDGAGNLKSWNEGPPTYNIAHYDYDELNQLKHFTVGSQEWLYMYDADDERVWSYRANVNPRFDRWTLRGLDGKVKRTFELTNYQWTNSWTGSNLWEDYVYRDGLLLSSSLDTGERRHMDVDHLGTVRLITNRFGGQPSYHVYLPYGEESTATFSAADTERMKFTGHERDLADATSDQDDLDYMHARHYGPLTGRFLSVDRSLGRSKLPQSWNRYTYVVDNPLNLVDRTGLCGGSYNYATPPSDTTDLSGFLEFLQAGAMFVTGAANAFATDFAGGAGRYDINASGYSTGQDVGDVMAGAVGLQMIETGATLGVLGLAEDASGVLAIPGVATNVEGLAIATDGAVATATAFSKLTDDYRFRGRDSKRAVDAAFHRVVQELKLDKDQGQRLHREISGQGFDFDAILATAKAMFGK